MKDYKKGGKMSPRYGREHKGSMDSGYMGMISEDYSAPANMPQEVKHSYYPQNDYFDGYYLDDSIKGIDETEGDTMKKVEAHQSDSMY